MLLILERVEHIAEEVIRLELLLDERLVLDMLYVLAALYLIFTYAFESIHLVSWLVAN
jgi:hypothetical protein